MEYSIRDKVEFALKFDPVVETFTDLICQKITNQVSYLKSQLNTLQDQLSHQERIFARIEIRRQGKELLTCEYKNRLGCLGSHQCANCQTNYSVVNNNQAVEIIK
ncbi:MAG: hypothetical protein NY202_03920 [Mollicutes bacterium UO1]